MITGTTLMLSISQQSYVILAINDTFNIDQLSLKTCQPSFVCYTEIVIDSNPRHKFDRVIYASLGK